MSSLFPYFGGARDDTMCTIFQFLQRVLIPKPPARTDHKAEHQSNQRLVRRIEALELRIIGAASQDKVQRLSRRVEGLELRFSVGAMPRRDPGAMPQTDLGSRTEGAGPQTNPLLPASRREEALEKEVESLRRAYEGLEGQLKTVQKKMKEMTERLRTLQPVAIANVSSPSIDKSWFYL